MSVTATIDRAVCAALDWADWFQDAHPTAAILALIALAVAGFTVAGTLE